MQCTDEPATAYHPNARAHHLDKSHQWPGEQRRPEQRQSMLRAGDRTRGNAGWVVIRRTGDDPRAEQRKKASDETRFGLFLRHSRGRPVELAVASLFAN